MKKATLVYSSKDYAHLPKTVLSSTDEPKCYFSQEEETLDDIIIKKYISLMFKQREKLDNISLFLYGKRSDVPENETRKAYLKVLTLERRLGKSIQFVSSEIKSCLNQDMLFFNKQNPITIHQILNAYKAICNNASKKDIWYQLFN